MYIPESRYILPQFEERTSYGTRHIDPYTKLYENRAVFLATQVDDTSASDIAAQLLALENMDPDAEISLYINSPGGSVSSMSMIVDTMNYIKPDVRTICLGMAASSAAMVLTSGAKGKRMALPNSTVMIHQPRISGNGHGQASDIEIQATQILRTRTWMEKMLVETTGQSPETVQEDVDRDRWFTAQEALDYGIIDEILYKRA